MIGSLALIGVAAVTGVAATRWPEVPPLVHLIAAPRRTGVSSVWATVHPTARVVVSTILSLVGIGALITIFDDSWLLGIDEPIYFDWLDAAEDKNRYGPEQLNWLGHPLPAIVADATVWVVTRRCGFISRSYPIILAVGWFTNVVLSWVTHRRRPVRGAHAGEFTSYPGGHSINWPVSGSGRFS